MRKRRFMSSVLAGAVILSLAACGSPQNTGSSAASGSQTSQTAENSSSKTESTCATESAAGGKKLTVWIEKIFSDDANTKLQDRVEQFGKENGVEVKCELVAVTDFVTKLNAVIEAGSGIPDVISADSSRILNYYPNLPCMDVSELVDSINKERPYFDAVYKGTKIGDAHYYVPFASSSTLMFVRKDKLAEKGITKMPATWDEVFETAEKVSDPANDFYGLGMGCGDTDDDDENMFREWLWNTGGSLFDKDGGITADSGKWAEIANKYNELYKKQVIPPDALSWDSDGNNGSYLAGRTAIVFNAPTLYNALKKSDETKKLLENTEILAPPSGSDNGIYLNFNRGFSIMNSCKDTDTAKAFLNYMLDKTWYDQYFELTAPIYAPVFQDEKQNETWTKDPVNAEVLKYAENASGFYGYPVSTIKGRAVAAKHLYTFPLEKVMNQVATGTKTAEDAINEQINAIKDFQDQVG